MASSFLSGGVRRGAVAVPHVVVCGKVRDPYMVLYKPASIPLHPSEDDLDRVPSITESLRRDTPQPFFFPFPLADQEQGLQIATRSRPVEGFLRSAVSRGLVRQGVSAMVQLPHCYNTPAASSCLHSTIRNPILDGMDSGIVLRAWLASSPRGRAAASRRMDETIARLFSVDTSSPAPRNKSTPGCAGCTCLAAEGTEHPFLSTVVHAFAEEVPGAVCVEAAGNVSARHAETPLGAPAATVNLAAVGEVGVTELRAVLAAAGTPPLFDPLFNLPYISGMNAEGGTASPLARHNNKVLTDIGSFGTAISRVALQFPDPADKGNWDRMRSQHPPTDLTEWRMVSITVPSPPSWLQWLEHQFIDKGTHFAKASSRVSLAGADPIPMSNAGADKEKGALRSRRSSPVAPHCRHCFSTDHMVADCPQLNSSSAHDAFEQQLAELAGKPKQHRFCIICYGGHDVIACPHRLQGVDPTRRCPTCGDVYHVVFDCPKAKEMGFGDREKADQYARGLGFESWKALQAYKVNAEALRYDYDRAQYRMVPVKGKEEEFREVVLRGKEVTEHHHETDEDRRLFLPSPRPFSVERLGGRDDQVAGVRRKRKLKWYDANREQLRTQRMERAEAKRAAAAEFSAASGGASFVPEPIDVESVQL